MELGRNWQICSLGAENEICRSLMYMNTFQVPTRQRPQFYECERSTKKLYGDSDNKKYPVLTKFRGKKWSFR